MHAALIVNWIEYIVLPYVGLYAYKPLDLTNIQIVNFTIIDQWKDRYTDKEVLGNLRKETDNFWMNKRRIVQPFDHIKNLTKLRRNGNRTHNHLVLKRTLNHLENPEFVFSV